MTINPSTMSASEIARDVPARQITDGINRAHAALLKAIANGDDTTGWKNMHAKLTEALRLAISPNRTMQAAVWQYKPKHASSRPVYLGADRDGLAHYRVVAL